MTPSMIEAGILAADEARYQALYAQDMQALASLLHEDYVHIHANGKVDDKEGFLASIRSAKYRFLNAQRSQQRVRIFGSVSILDGTTATTVEVGPEQRVMHNAFSTVWTGGAGGWVMLHWQATKLPDTQPS